MFRIVFLGLCMFVKNGETRTVVIPDLSAAVNVMTPRGATVVEPHIAYISAARSDVQSCIGCEIRIDEDDIERQVLYLRGDTVEISGMGGEFNEHPDYDKTIPRITQSCPQFRLSIPATATTIRLTSGNLSANCTGGYKCQKCDNCKGTACEKCEKCEKDQVCHSHLDGTPLNPPVVLEIKATRGDLVRSMQIKLPVNNQAREVTISNRYAAGFLNHKKIPPLAENHWLAFYSLSRGSGRL